MSVAIYVDGMILTGFGIDPSANLLSFPQSCTIRIQKSQGILNSFLINIHFVNRFQSMPHHLVTKSLTWALLVFHNGMYNLSGVSIFLAQLTQPKTEPDVHLARFDDYWANVLQFAW